MIPGAISREEFELRRQSLVDVPFVAYRMLGYRNGKYVDRLRRKEFDAWSLSSGVLSWTHAGRPLVDKYGGPRRVHV